MNQNKVLFIGRVWPEPTSSAAGTRMLQLIDFFAERYDEVIFSCPATKTEASYLPDYKNLSQRQIEINSNTFNDFISDLKPDIVVYDRFVSEEQFGWRVRQESPDTLEILDTEDLHFLRFAREKAYKHKTETDHYNEITIREIASILRCDLSLIISEFEMKLLTEEFNISPSLLHYLPFIEDLSKIDFSQNLEFEERKDFIFIGNFLHSPNLETVLRLKKEIWPEIQKKLKGTKLNIYGAYPTQRVYDLNSEKDNFLIHGKTENALEVIAKSRLMLAPIPYGAGIKGKFTDAMKTGCPVATTTVGAEAMFEDDFPGIIEDDLTEFVQKSIQLYLDKEFWTAAQSKGYEILKKKFDGKLFINIFNDLIIDLQDNIANHRKNNFTGNILKQNQFNALKYMSLWIEEKNKP